MPKPEWPSSSSSRVGTVHDGATPPSDICHTYASRALALGESLTMIGKLLGHSDIETTARYAHLAHDSIHETAERIAESIAADIL